MTSSSNSPESKPKWLQQILQARGRSKFLLSDVICIPSQGSSNYFHYILCRSVTENFVYTGILGNLFLLIASSETSPKYRWSTDVGNGDKKSLIWFINPIFQHYLDERFPKKRRRKFLSSFSSTAFNFWSHRNTFECITPVSCRK